MINYYYKNISYSILKRLLQEANIIMILLLALYNFAIEVGLPSDSLAYLYGLLDLFLVMFFIFLDATKLKSRQFLLIIVFNFVAAAISLTLGCHQKCDTAQMGSKSDCSISKYNYYN